MSRFPTVCWKTLGISPGPQTSEQHDMCLVVHFPREQLCLRGQPDSHLKSEKQTDPPCSCLKVKGRTLSAADRMNLFCQAAVYSAVLNYHAVSRTSRPQQQSSGHQQAATLQPLLTGKLTFHTTATLTTSWPQQDLPSLLPTG